MNRSTSSRPSPFSALVTYTGGIRCQRLSMVACGTAFYACLTAKYWFEKLARIPVEVDVASEFRYREPPIPKQTAALFVSQSGETADTLAALRYCAGKADKILSVTNVAESSIARESDQTYPMFAGVEIGVASTKAFTCQLTVLLSLALKAAQDRGTMSETELKDAANAMRSAPGLLNVALEQSDAIKHHARKLSQARDILFLGRGLMYPLAHEGALKLKEDSYLIFLIYLQKRALFSCLDIYPFRQIISKGISLRNSNWSKG